jgi:hypothetical protein
VYFLFPAGVVGAMQRDADRPLSVRTVATFGFKAIFGSPFSFSRRPLPCNLAIRRGADASRSAPFSEPLGTIVGTSRGVVSSPDAGCCGPSVPVAARAAASFAGPTLSPGGPGSEPIAAVWS